jgi:hypothetical protein
MPVAQAPPTATSAAPAAAEFVDRLRGYATTLGSLLSQPAPAPWKPSTWGSRRRATTDPELRKVLQRLYGLTDELLRLYTITPSDDGADGSGLTSQQRQRVLDLIGTDPSTFSLDAGLEVFDAFDRLMIEIGDARYLCAEVEAELRIRPGTTTWVTWPGLFGDARPPALATYYKGVSPYPTELEAVRRMLGSLRRVRSDDYQVHRSRQRQRAHILYLLSVLLLPIVLVLAWLIVSAGDVPADQVGLVAVSGAAGAIVAGTLKARDRLVRGSDLRAFRSGVVSQILVGAGSALFLLVVLESGIVEFGLVDVWAGQAVGGFVAGFSEPFVLRTVERVARLGADDPPAG